jgi:hypothetical protein
MKNELVGKNALNDYLGCYGNFNIQDTICKKFCALSLRCAIDRDHNTRLEMLEDLMTSDCQLTKPQ